MSVFRTTVEPTPSRVKISLNQSILTIGSCFAEVMGNRLSDHKFKASTNPFGTLFNPVSIHTALQHGILDQHATKEKVVRQQGMHHHYDFHSNFSSSNQDELLAKINKTITQTHTHLTNTKWLIITYGTAWVYTLNATGQLVANCHKMPADLFTKTLLSVESIVESFTELQQSLTTLNDDVQIIITVSPVRHTKDTMELNAVSKSILRIACHKMQHTFNNVHYFPAYEMMMDDLRDYRFYKDDMIHPSFLAEEYIWNHFVKSYVDEEGRTFIKDWTQIRSDLQHKAFHLDSNAHQNFLKKLYHKISTYTNHLDVKDELRTIQNQLHDKMQ